MTLQDLEDRYGGILDIVTGFVDVTDPAATNVNDSDTPVEFAARAYTEGTADTNCMVVSPCGNVQIPAVKLTEQRIDEAFIHDGASVLLLIITSEPPAFAVISKPA